MDAPKGDQTVTTFAIRPGWFPHLFCIPSTNVPGTIPSHEAAGYATQGLTPSELEVLLHYTSRGTTRPDGLTTRPHSGEQKQHMSFFFL